MLELITSKQPIEHGKYIVREVRNVIQEEGILGLQHLQDTHLVDCPTEDLKAFLDLALRCVEEVAALRPTMRQVAKELETLLTYSQGVQEPAPTSVVANGHIVANGHVQHEPQELDYPADVDSPCHYHYPEGMDVDSPFQYSGVVPVFIEPK